MVIKLDKISNKNQDNIIESDHALLSSIYENWSMEVYVGEVRIRSKEGPSSKDISDFRLQVKTCRLVC